MLPIPPPQPSYEQPLHRDASDADDPREIERQISGLNWPGFFLGWIWAVGNGVWIGLLGILPVVNLVMAIVLLVTGRRWAWEKGNWRNLEHFVEVQRRWLIATCIIVPVVVIGLGGLGAFAVYGFRKFQFNVKRAEATNAVGRLGRSLAHCAETQGLPPSSMPVPTEVPKGARYPSNSVDWSQPVFVCADFQLRDPQYYQYLWERSTAQSGVVRAAADLDGDGNVDQLLELSVTCSGGSCLAGKLVTVKGD